jgi:hypothetical protein
MIQARVIQQYHVELEYRDQKPSGSFQRQDTVVDEPATVQGPHQGIPQEVAESPLESDDGFVQKDSF